MPKQDNSGRASVWTGTGIWIAALTGIMVLVILLAWLSSDYSNKAGKSLPAAANPDGSAPANRTGYPPGGR